MNCILDGVIGLQRFITEPECLWHSVGYKNRVNVSILRLGYNDKDVGVFSCKIRNPNSVIVFSFHYTVSCTEDVDSKKIEIKCLKR
jgi:hypothetical protein